MGNLDESNQTSKDLKSENATKNNADEAIVQPAVGNDESIQFDSNKELITFTSSSSSTSSDEEDLQILDSKHNTSSIKMEADDHLATKHDETLNENVNDSGSPTFQIKHQETAKYGIPSHVFSRKILTGPGNWSMASNESLFSIRMGGTSFCHLDSFGPELNFPYDSELVNETILETDEENDQESKEDKRNHLSATSSSRSDSFVFPILSGETEKDGSPNPRGLLIGPVRQSIRKLEPAPEPGSDAKAESKETTTSIAWTVWFPCFRYCACCS